MSDPIAETFERYSLVRGIRIRCRICGAVGYPKGDGEYPGWWGWVHLGDHEQCPLCGKWYVHWRKHARHAHGDALTLWDARRHTPGQGGIPSPAVQGKAL